MAFLLNLKTLIILRHTKNGVLKMRFFNFFTSIIKRHGRPQSLLGGSLWTLGWSLTLLNLGACSKMNSSLSYSSSSSFLPVYCSSARNLKLAEKAQVAPSKLQLNIDYLEAKNREFQSLNALSPGRPETGEEIWGSPQGSKTWKK